MWTKEALNQLIEEKLRDHKLIVVANREPYIHRFAGGEIECIQPASGLTSALDPILQACGGTWVAHGSGNADRYRVDQQDHVAVPPDQPRYTLRRVWLSKDEEEGYYYGLSNECLWPLCHVTFTRPTFSARDWEIYRQVNQRFAQAVLEEAENRPACVFIQDYHFGLLPRMLKKANPNLIVAQFWHIPWPNREVFRVFPWGEELLDGLLGNDLLGFHLRNHCQNFLDTVDRTLEARVDVEGSEVVRGGKATEIRPFPISIDFEAQVELAQSRQVEKEMDRWRHQLRLGDKLLGIGIERLDYTKGIPERLMALDLFLENHPAYRNKLLFVQIAVPSRTHILQYKDLEEEVERLVEQINWKWGANGWRNLVLLKEHHDPLEMVALHRLSQFCMVTSLHDGMNLVAKEYVASRLDDGGMLILSQFTGAARELTEALLVNPYDLEQTAEAIRQALEMPAAEQAKRMHKMRAAVASNNIYRWAGKAVSALLRFDFPEMELQQEANWTQGEAFVSAP